MTSTDKVRTVVEQLALVNPYTNAKDLPEIPRPETSSIPRELPPLQQLPYVQKVLNMLSYNFLPQTFFCLEKHRSLQSILITSREILTEALPIRCLEATFVGLYLTHGLQGVDRIPLSFKSRAKGRAYHHIVLVIRCDGLYGALGLSRKSTLMDKPMIYRSLFDLIMEYKKQYEVIGHELVDFKLGLCVSHELNSRKAPCWRYIAVNLAKADTPSRLASPRSTGEGEITEHTEFSSDVVLVEGNRENINHLSDLTHLLYQYTVMLSTMSQQYEKYAVSFIPGTTSQPQPKCLMDLHEMEDTAAREENKRRLEEVRKGRSPCASISVGTKRRATSRSVSKKRGYSTGGTLSSSTTSTNITNSSTVGSATIRATVSQRASVIANKSAKKESSDILHVEEHVKTPPPPPPPQQQQQQQQQEEKQEVEEEEEEEQQQQQHEQLPQVSKNVSNSISVVSPNGTLDSSSGITQNMAQNSLSSLVIPSLPFLETKSNEFSISNDSWGVRISLHHNSDETKFHDLL